jgi:hypothetical protein
VREEGGSAEIHPCELIVPWVYDEKFLTGMRFLFGTLPSTMVEDDNIEYSAKE